MLAASSDARPEAISVEDRERALQALCARYSAGPKQLVEPGPSDADLNRMMQAVLRAPDHAELAPYRFVVVRGEARARLATLFKAAAIEAGKDDAGASMDAERALRPPMTLAVLARIDPGHPLVPAHEQWVAVGAALSQFLQAAHLLGYAGKMLSGAKVRQPLIVRAFCQPGESLLGWIALGTSKPGSAQPSGRASRKPAAEQLWSDWA